MPHSFPEAGFFLRLHQILGNPKSKPPTPPLLPLSKSTWWAGVKTGRFPKPVKLSERITAWRAEDIRELLDLLAKEGQRSDEPGSLDQDHNPVSISQSSTRKER